MTETLGLTSRLPPDITDSRQIIRLGGKLAGTHALPCNTYRIPKQRHLKSISISLIPHLVADLHRPSDKLFPIAFVTPFGQIGRRGKNVKKINLSGPELRLSKLEGQVEPRRKKSPNSPNHRTHRGSRTKYRNGKFEQQFFSRQRFRWGCSCKSKAVFEKR